MTFLSKKAILELLTEHDLRPDKRLGQNFLIDQNILMNIVQAGKLGPASLVIEVGAGLGNLTTFLGDQAKEVVAVEKSDRLLPLLNERLTEYKNIKVICSDILELKLEDLVSSFESSTGKPVRYSVIANIPYNITGHLLRYFLETDTPPENLILLIQKDVADRLLAAPPDMNLLAVSVQYFGKVETVDRVSASCFYPRPDVESAVIRITPDPKAYMISPADRDNFFRLLRAGYGQKRKQLASLLSKQLGLDRSAVEARLTSLGLPVTARAQELSVDHWKALLSVIPE